MSVQDTSLNPKIFNSAMKEFLEKGFLNASVKEICDNAGVTTGALYKRYKGKAQLFDAVVEPLYDKIKEFGLNRQNRSIKFLDDKDLSKIWDNSEEVYVLQTKFFYENYDAVRLLLCSSEGTKHSNFLHNFVRDNTEATYSFCKEVYKKGLSKELIDKDELHMILSAYWTCIFEPIIHEYSEEKAIRSAKTLYKFFNWKEALGF